MKKKCVPYILLLVLVQPSNGQIRVLQSPWNFGGQGFAPSQFLAEKEAKPLLNAILKCNSKYYENITLWHFIFWQNPTKNTVKVSKSQKQILEL